MLVKKNKRGLVDELNQQKESEKKLKKSLREKEILLSELHHRVQNNMALVYALFELQCNYSGNDRMQDAMSDCKMRIKSLSMIFETLNGSEYSAEINIGTYLEQLICHISRAYNTREKGIIIERTIPSVHLNINQAVPCGLIINELLVNACKHAFCGDGSNRIFVELEELEERIRLRIADNGKGLPVDIDHKSPTTLGFTITRSLTAQLKGELHVTVNGGTAFELTFQKSAIKGPSNSLSFSELL